MNSALDISTSPSQLTQQELEAISVNRIVEADNIPDQAAALLERYDVSDAGVISNLALLTGSLQKQAGLNKVGLYAAHSEINECLKTRLFIAQYHKQHPGVSEQPITAPTVITGLPRTGTSILFELLSQDKNHRSPKVLEAKTPYKTLDHQHISNLESELEYAQKVAPDLIKQHNIGINLGEDCCRFLQYSFTGYRYMWQYDVPDQFNGMLATDMSKAYQLHKQFMQFMQHKNAVNQTWLLKSNGHIPFIAYLNDTYPDMNVFHTFRDPVELMASTISMVCTNRSIYSDHVDKKTVATQQLAFWKHCVAIYYQALEQSADLRHKIFDFSYARFMKSPLDEIQRGYDYHNLTLANDDLDAMARYIKENPHHKHGKHHYCLSDYGLDQTEVYQAFEQYLDLHPA